MNIKRRLSINTKPVFLVILGFTISYLAYYFFFQPNGLYYDEHIYIKLARALDYDEYFNSVDYFTHRTPGYHLIIYLVSKIFDLMQQNPMKLVNIMIIIQCLLSSVMLFIFYQTINCLYNSKLAFKSTLFLLLQPSFVFPQMLIMSDHLYTLTIILLLFLFINILRRKYLIICSILFVLCFIYAWLIRPQIVLFIPFLSYFIVAKHIKKYIKRILIITSIIVLSVVISWGIFNYLRFDSFIFGNIMLGQMFLYANSPDNVGTIKGKDWHNTYFAKCQVYLTSKGYSYPERNRIYIEHAFNLIANKIKNEPINFIKTEINKILYLWQIEFKELIFAFYHKKYTHLSYNSKILITLYFIIMHILLFSGVILAIAYYSINTKILKNRFIMFNILYILSMILITLIFIGEPRFRFSLTPILCFFSIYGFSRIKKVFQNRKSISIFIIFLLIYLNILIFYNDYPFFWDLINNKI